MKLLLLLLALLPTSVFADVYYDGRYGGRAGWYSRPQCNSPTCRMDNYIRQLLAVANAHYVQSEHSGTRPVSQSTSDVQVQQEVTNSYYRQGGVQYLRQVTPLRTIIWRLGERTRSAIQRVRRCNGRTCWYENVTVEVPYKLWIRVTTTEHNTTTHGTSIHEPATDRVTELHPTPYDVIPELLYILSPENDQVFCDLGSGDGRVAIAVAETFGVRTFGIELDPQSIRLARLTADTVGANVTFIEGDILKQDLSKIDVAYVYLYESLLPKIMKQVSSGTRLVSYLHPFPGVRAKKYGTEHTFYEWTKP